MRRARLLPAEFAAELERRVRRIIWCTLATTDSEGRPRTRIVHPWWKDATAWVTTRPGSPKVGHVTVIPAVSLLHWDPAQQVVTAECDARMERSPGERARVWDAIAAEPAPCGFGPGPIFPGGPADPAFGPPRPEARRIELADAPEPAAGAV